MKVLNNYRKSKRLNGTTKGKIGTELKIIDKNNTFVHVGDFVKYFNYQGYVLYNPECKQYGVALDYSLWYGDDIFNIDSYGKFVPIPLDNGDKINIEVIKSV